MTRSPEAATLNQTRDANRGAAAALDVTAAERRDGVIQIHPHCAGAAADGRRMGLLSGEALQALAQRDGGFSHGVTRP